MGFLEEKTSKSLILKEVLKACQLVQFMNKISPDTCREPWLIGLIGLTINNGYSFWYNPMW